MSQHPTYIVAIPISQNGKSRDVYLPCCEGCGWSGQQHAQRRNARAEEREHLTKAAPAPELRQDALFTPEEVA